MIRAIQILPWVAACILGCWAISEFQSNVDSNSRTEVRQPNNYGLFIRAERLSFGRVWETERFHWTLPIENHERDDLEILDFATSCTCLTVEPRSLRIPAGQIRQIRLVLDLTAQTSKQADAQWRDFEVRISPRLRSNPPSHVDGWKIHGRVQSAIRFDARVIDFGTHSELAQPLTHKKVVITSFLPLQRVVAESPTDYLRVKAKPMPADSRRFELTIAPAILPKRKFQFDIRIVAELVGGKRVPAILLPVTGLLVSDIQASPPAAFFGARQIGTLAEELICFQSITNRQFQVELVRFVGEGLAVDKQPAVNREQCPVFRVKQRILRQGESAGKVFFRIRDARGNSEIVVPVSYLGLTEAVD